MTEFRVIPSHPTYQAGSDGSILGQRGKRLSLFAGTGGYLRFTTHNAGTWQQVSAHVMVCEAFHGPRPSPEHHATHRNGVKTDNRAENLRWLTRSENEADKRAHGTSLEGERHHQVKLTEVNVREIRCRLLLGDTGADLAREFRVTPTTISYIKKRKTWRHVS